MTNETGVTSTDRVEVKRDVMDMVGVAKLADKIVGRRKDRGALCVNLPNNDKELGSRLDEENVALCTDVEVVKTCAPSESSERSSEETETVAMEKS